MSSSNSSIRKAITGMPSGPEEEDSFDVDEDSSKLSSSDGTSDF